MLQLFGTGQGRVLLRGVGQLLQDDQEHGAVLRPSEGCGTRPLAHSDRVCKSLIRNYRFYHTGLLARLAQTRGPERRGAQTLTKLVTIGRRIAALDFVVFLLFFNDISSRTQRPFAVLTETCDVEAIAMHRKCLSVCGGLLGDASLLEHLRVLAQVSAIVSYARFDADLEDWWAAWRWSAVGRRFPLLGESMCDLLHARRYAGSLPVRLQTKPPQLETGI